jgi:serine/threonine protein kinase
MAYVHAMGWVHKAVRPSNILMLHGHDDVAFPHGLGHAFLVGFEYARRGAARSTGSGHWGWKDEIYRHPDRQNKDGVDLETHFVVKHDIYSAGVVLLELGAWRSLAEDCPSLKRADPDERRRLLLGYSDTIAGTIGSRYAALAKKCIAVDVSELDVEQLLTELQELRI